MVFTVDGTVLSGPIWETEVRQKTFTWLYRARTWICSAQSLHIVHFENLRKNLGENLEKILEYMYYEKDQLRMDCATKHAVRKCIPNIKLS